MDKFLVFLTEALAWLQILSLPLVIGIGLGGWLYLSNPTKTNLVLGIIIAAVGLIIGILWANHIRKTKGTVSFMSKVSDTTDIKEMPKGKE